MSYKALVPCPSRTSMNSGLSPARVETLVSIFGAFPTLTDTCAPCQNERVKRLVQTRDVGPFRATGIAPALDDLSEIFAKVKSAHPDLYSLIGTAGMMCYRRVRGSKSTPSNHAVGTAIDLKIAGTLSLFNAKFVPSGLVILYGYFHAHDWFWAAGYKGRTDPMHFEVSDEKLRRWKAEGRL